MTMNLFGLGKAIYIGTMSHQFFYHDLVAWLRETCDLHPKIKVPDSVEAGTREKDGTKIHFLLNHQNTSLHVQLYSPMHDILTDEVAAGGRDLPPHGVLVLNELPENSTSGHPTTVAEPEADDSDVEEPT